MGWWKEKKEKPLEYKLPRESKFLHSDIYKRSDIHMQEVYEVSQTLTNLVKKELAEDRANREAFHEGFRKMVEEINAREAAAALEQTMETAKSSERSTQSNPHCTTILKTILKAPDELKDTPIKYRVVLDIDATFCQEIPSYSRDIVDREWIAENFPDGELIDWMENFKHHDLYYCYPNFDKLVLSILSWSGWSVDFFSAGIEERNKPLISSYFTKKFSKYGQNVQEDYYDTYYDITTSRRLQTFSSHHMRNCYREDYVRGSYEQYGQMKKDLTVISSDVNNVIIADDDRSYIFADQYPFIGLADRADEFTTILRRKDTQEKVNPNPNKNADYIMGIVLSCKEMLDNNEDMSLREVLDIVMRHNGDSSIEQYQDDGRKNRDYSPWFLHPSYELNDMARSRESCEDSVYCTKMTEWISKGQDYFDEFCSG